jgi:hypothetical protein
MLFKDYKYVNLAQRNRDEKKCAFLLALLTQAMISLFFFWFRLKGRVFHKQSLE